MADSVATDPFEELGRDVLAAAQGQVPSVRKAAGDLLDPDHEDYAPEALKGSILESKVGEVFPGGGKYALVRCWQSVVRPTGDVSATVKVTNIGSASDAHSRDAEWLRRYCGRAVLGICSDGKSSSPQASAAKAEALVKADGARVVAVATRSSGALPSIDRVQVFAAADLAALPMDLDVESAVVELGESWLPWTGQAEAAVISSETTFSAEDIAVGDDAIDLKYDGGLLSMLQTAAAGIGPGATPANVRSNILKVCGIADDQEELVVSAVALVSFVAYALGGGDAEAVKLLEGGLLRGPGGDPSPHALVAAVLRLVLNLTSSTAVSAATRLALNEADFWWQHRREPPAEESDIYNIYARWSVSEHADASRAMTQAGGIDVEDMVPGFTQPGR